MSGERVRHSGEKVEDDLFHMFGYLRRTLADSSFQNRRLASAERAEVPERQIPVSRFQLAPPRSVHQGTQQIPDSRFQNRLSGLLWAGQREQIPDSRFHWPLLRRSSESKEGRSFILYRFQGRGTKGLMKSRFQIADSRRNVGMFITQMRALTFAPRLHITLLTFQPFFI